MNDHDGTHRSVLVGYDGSPAADLALRWAVEEARLRGLDLTVWHAWQWPYSSRPPDDKTLEAVRGAGAVVADEGVRKAHAAAGGLQIRRCLERGSASATLLKAARDAALIVLGTRGHDGFEGLPVGSTAVQVASHADRPVIVVRPDPGTARWGGGRIVVGVDGSPASRAALGLAVEEAGLHGASVTALCCWWDPALLPGPDRIPFVDPEALRREAVARFERVVDPWRAERPEVPIETEFVIDTPRRALVNAAQGAALLVVGTRGIGSLPQMPLGPVPQVALQEAPCTVAVVPAPQDGQREDGGTGEGARPAGRR